MSDKSASVVFTLTPLVVPVTVKSPTFKDDNVPTLVMFGCAAVPIVPVIVPVNVGFANEYGGVVGSSGTFNTVEVERSFVSSGENG